jgi:hypothetical protein
VKGKSIVQHQCQTINIASQPGSDKPPTVVKTNLLPRSEGPGRLAPGQSRRSLAPAPAAEETGVFPFPKVVVVYDDAPAGQQAMRTLTNLFPEPTDRLQLVPRLWRFDFLEDTGCFTLALADALEADIILIATSSTDGLNISVQDLINSCLPRKRGNRAAVVALLGPEQAMDGADSPRWQFLEGAAHKAGLDFFAPVGRPPVGRQRGIQTIGI